jgi:glycosyltransferase involved in cell wall biosynthesis
MNTKSTHSPRIAWLLTSAFYYWQPMLSNLAKLFPETMTFTPRWHGYAPGFENSFPVEIVGKRKIITFKDSETGYGSSFTYLPLNIASYLFKFKPDIIFSNSFGIWTIICLLFKPFGKWRVVIAYEGSSPSVDYLHSPMRLTLRRLMVRASDACITNSNGGQRYLTEVLGAHKQRVFVHPYEVPCVESLLGEVQEKSETIVSDTALSKKPVFLYVGSLTSRKGLLHLLEACVVLKKKGCEQYSLEIIGDGSQKDTLQAFSHSHNLTNNVHWIGKLDYGELGLYFHQADAFIIPTLEDTWGVVVLEAMAFGKAILCSERAGASELVVEGKNGFRFNPHNHEQIANAMKQFIDEPSLSLHMGQQSKALMEQYSPKAAADFLSQVAKTVLED